MPRAHGAEPDVADPIDAEREAGSRSDAAEAEADPIGPGATSTAAPQSDPSATAGGRQQRWITRRRLAKWNRPRPPRDWRWGVTHVGRILIAAGVLLFGFVAYQLWGTNLETARAQRALSEEFDQLLAAAPPAPAPPTDPGQGGDGETDAPPEDGTGGETVDDPGEPADDGTGDDSATADPDPDTPAAPEIPEIEPEAGAPLARISLPSLDVEEIVVSGVRPEDLQKGPGHFPSTPLPGHLGNSALAGHRTTYGAPFRDVDRLEPGDEIVVTTIQGTFTYLVTGTEIVAPQDSHVVATTDFEVASLTLVSCHPVLSAAQRIIVYAEMDLERSTPISLEPEPEPEPVPEPEPLPEPEQPGAALADLDRTLTGGAALGVPLFGVDFGRDELDDAFGRGWFHDTDAFGQIAIWGALLTLVSLGSYLLSRVTRRDLVGFTIGIAPFVVASFFFFQNVNRLLPPGL